MREAAQQSGPLQRKRDSAQFTRIVAKGAGSAEGPAPTGSSAPAREAPTNHTRSVFIQRAERQRATRKNNAAIKPRSPCAGSADEHHAKRAHPESKRGSEHKENQRGKQAKKRSSRTRTTKTRSQKEPSRSKTYLDVAKLNEKRPREHAMAIPNAVFIQRAEAASNEANNR